MLPNASWWAPLTAEAQTKVVCVKAPTHKTVLTVHCPFLQELQEVYGDHVHLKHIHLVADKMTHSGSVLPMNLNGFKEFQRLIRLPTSATFADAIHAVRSSPYGCHHLFRFSKFFFLSSFRTFPFLFRCCCFWILVRKTMRHQTLKVRSEA
jgi:hypothetical protein